MFGLVIFSSISDLLSYFKGNKFLHLGSFIVKLSGMNY